MNSANGVATQMCAIQAVKHEKKMKTPKSIACDFSILSSKELWTRQWISTSQIYAIHDYSDMVCLVCI